MTTSRPSSLTARTPSQNREARRVSLSQWDVYHEDRQCRLAGDQLLAFTAKLYPFAGRVRRGADRRPQIARDSNHSQSCYCLPAIRGRLVPKEGVPHGFPSRPQESRCCFTDNDDGLCARTIRSIETASREENRHAFTRSRMQYAAHLKSSSVSTLA